MQPGTGRIALPGDTASNGILCLYLIEIDEDAWQLELSRAMIEKAYGLGHDLVIARMGQFFGLHGSPGRNMDAPHTVIAFQSYRGRCA